MESKSYFTFIYLMAFCCLGLAQQIVEVGILYQPGDSIYGPKNGVMTSMPEGWVGGVPEGAELFIMESLKHTDAQIYARANPDDLTSKVERWKSGVRLSRALDIQLTGEITIQDNLISAEFKNNANPNSRLYAEAKCGEYGSCFVLFLMAWKDSYEAAKTDLSKMMKNTALVEPYLQNLHDNFDWSEFLNEKYLYSYLYDGVQQKSNNLWLCPDNTFKLELKRKGAAIVKNNRKYYGKTSGSWSVEGMGPKSKVTLDFNKDLDPVTFEIEIRVNKIYINGDRHFTVKNNDCK